MALPRLKKMLGFADGTSDTSNPWAAAVSRVTAATSGLGQGVYDALQATPAAQVAQQRMQDARAAFGTGDYGRALGAGAAAVMGAGAGAPLEAASRVYNDAMGVPATVEAAGGRFLRNIVGGYAGAPAAAAPPVASAAPVAPPSPFARPAYADYQPLASAAPAAPARGIHFAAVGEVPQNNTGGVDVARAGVMSPNEGGGGGGGLPLQLRAMMIQAQINRAMQPAAVQAAHELLGQAGLAYAFDSNNLLKKYGAAATSDNPDYVAEQRQVEARHVQALRAVMAGQQYDLMQSLQADQQQPVAPSVSPGYGLMPGQQ